MTDFPDRDRLQNYYERNRSYSRDGAWYKIDYRSDYRGDYREENHSDFKDQRYKRKHEDLL